uniref:40S ribosomal protein S21 n=1 Tax=Suricata suricatta TaxID=37032 RepID=A0A673U5H0_SURSU
MHNNAGKFMDLYVNQKCSTSNHIISVKDHRSVQMNIAKVDKVTSKLNVSLKTLLSVGPFVGWVSQTTPSFAWPQSTASFQRTSDWRGSEGCGIFVINK